MATGSLFSQASRRFVLLSCFYNRSLFTQSSGDELSHVLHKPVMLKEVLAFLSPRDGQVFVDGTFGAGGHTCAILNAANCKVFALDRDPVSVDIARVLSERPEFKERILPFQGKFSQLYETLKEHGVKDESVDGMLFDIGASSIQLDDPERGFSLRQDGPLDMRMDGPPTTSSTRKKKEKFTFTAADVINSISESDLASVLRQYGQERDSGRIARAVIKAREKFPIFSTKQLAEIIAAAVGFTGRKDKIGRFAHPATKTFQALRILVNDELNELRHALRASQKLLSPGGRLVVVSFHSLEDSIVKYFLKDTKSSMNLLRTKQNLSTKDSSSQTKVSTWVPLHKKVVQPKDEEVFLNPRSRSAKLRAAVKADKSVLDLRHLTTLLNSKNHKPASNGAHL